MTEVVAALIRDGERFLICQRPAHKARGLLWEFVGGKVEPGETKEQALVRECREELDITVEPLDVYMEVVHAYPDLTVQLTLFDARIASGVPKKLEQRPALDSPGGDSAFPVLPGGRNHSRPHTGGLCPKENRISAGRGLSGVP